eukprot:CAMPEP_0170651004 /NCGR_PEP_ID=MMETSP0224-20130122/46112_1 /TAXON_ID=285029 /ORGANISM="Togula jolla, Strain CCCM 725" /LENGTH=75 /DNA_ID=CAMNT_0010982719 /DNA_START=267 /DNA_END=494 /DNA_ORIENTATION=-
MRGATPGTPKTTRVGNAWTLNRMACLGNSAASSTKTLKGANSSETPAGGCVGVSDAVIVTSAVPPAARPPPSVAA